MPFPQTVRAAQGSRSWLSTDWRCSSAWRNRGLYLGRSQRKPDPGLESPWRHLSHNLEPNRRRLCCCGEGKPHTGLFHGQSSRLHGAVGFAGGCRAVSEWGDLLETAQGKHKEVSRAEARKRRLWWKAKRLCSSVLFNRSWSCLLCHQHSWACSLPWRLHTGDKH